jgi:uncharacterized protein with PQ loop repeat
MAFDSIDILGIGCSIAGALIFLIAIKSEINIISQLKKIKRPLSWQVATGFTIFFFFGYVVNVVAILTESELLNRVFNSLVFLFGAIFLVLVVSISEKTYRAIFEIAQADIGEDLEFDET